MDQERLISSNLIHFMHYLYKNKYNIIDKAANATIFILSCRKAYIDEILYYPSIIYHLS